MRTRLSNSCSVPMEGPGLFIFEGCLEPGWNGKPNQGVRMDPKDIAKMIVTIEKRLKIHGRVRPGPADSSIWDGDPAKSIATVMAQNGCRWYPEPLIHLQ